MLNIAKIQRDFSGFFTYVILGNIDIKIDAGIVLLIDYALTFVSIV
ncbi:hypothetical protein HMPREF8578_1205 [Streptococcus oralis ATCC 49296]|uniref:Uncharacterized protein n=1 Tax=Streptococcus oralis ATCC 49296 TaxID=888049 RepID=E6KLJ0_STROR|nr:hypothetical protein HMPREF8578_1205 [Streptococcus oralis ATCC 49296]